MTLKVKKFGPITRTNMDGLAKAELSGENLTKNELSEEKLNSDVHPSPVRYPTGLNSITPDFSVACVGSFLFGVIVGIIIASE